MLTVVMKFDPCFPATVSVSRHRMMEASHDWVARCRTSTDQQMPVTAEITSNFLRVAANLPPWMAGSLERTTWKAFDSLTGKYTVVMSRSRKSCPRNLPDFVLKDLEILASDTPSTQFSAKAKEVAHNLDFWRYIPPLARPLAAVYGLLRKEYELSVSNCLGAFLLLLCQPIVSPG